MHRESPTPPEIGNSRIPGGAEIGANANGGSLESLAIPDTRHDRTLEERNMKVVIALLAVVLSLASPAFAETLIELQPQPGVPLLGVSCGGVHTSTYVTGFNDEGDIAGEVYAWTRCGVSGRGGGYHSKLYYSWHSIEWDLNGVALTTLPYDGIVPDETFTETNDAGDTVYGVSISTSYGTAYEGMLRKPD
jgi:hypothetical protein